MSESKNLSDLNDALFVQLGRLNDDSICGEKLQEEVERSKAITGVASKIVENAKLALEGEKIRLEYAPGHYKAPKMLDSK